MALPGDVDLTLRMDFNKYEPSLCSVKLSKETKHVYKRYHEYEIPSTSSTNTHDPFKLTQRGTAALQEGFMYGWIPTVKVEERVCWRKLYKDPRVYVQSLPVEEWEEKFKQYNFALGSKNDRLLIKYELKQKEHEFCSGTYCDCCGQKLKKNNCLAYNDTLCQRCFSSTRSTIRSIDL